MTEIVRFKTPSGDDMVTLPAAVYDQLVVAAGNADDVSVYDRVKRQLATGEEEMLPSDIADRLLAGENPIRVWREHRKLTSSALAAKADIAQGFLSQIENGKRDGTVGTLVKIAAALGVALDDLVFNTEAPKDAQALIAEKIERLLATVASASDAEVHAAVGDHGSLNTITNALQDLLRRGRVGHTGHPGPGEPMRYFLPTAEEAED